MLADEHGSEIFIICSGASLTGFDFGRLANRFTLGCNRAALDANAKAIFTVDTTYLAAKWKQICATFSGIKINGVKTQGQRDEFPTDVPLWHRRREDFSRQRGTVFGLNSGHAAANFAALEGFKTIHLLGMDLNDVGRWHAGYNNSPQNRSQLLMWAEQMNAGKAYFDEMGVQVFNYSDVSAVGAFPFRDLADL